MDNLRKNINIRKRFEKLSTKKQNTLAGIELLLDRLNGVAACLIFLDLVLDLVDTAQDSGVINGSP